jgi:hypothetical protein
MVCRSPHCRQPRAASCQECHERYLDTAVSLAELVIFVSLILFALLFCG